MPETPPMPNSLKSSKTPKDDLAYLTTEELWQELAKRFQTAVLIYESPAKIPGQICSDVKWNCGQAAFIGLLAWAQKHADLVFKDIYDAD